MIFRFTLLLSILFTANMAIASQKRFEVTITNITKAQTFTPQYVATHKKSYSLFTLGMPASDSLELLAEGGNTMPLMEDIRSTSGGLSRYGEVLTVPGLLGPGETTTFVIKGHYKNYYLSLAAMLLPTNDAFVALSAVKLPRKGSVSYYATAYDAGTEKNDQICLNIPGGADCSGEGHSMSSDLDEGYVYIGNGFQYLGDMDADGNMILKPAMYDWNNPVALITITRIKSH